MNFPRKPFLDRVMIEVTPIEKIFDQGKVAIDLENEHTRTRSDRGVVVAVGDGVPMGGVLIPMPVEVGDEVYFHPSTGYAGQFYLKPSDEYKTDLPIYIELRVGDLKGRARRSIEVKPKLGTLAGAMKN